MSALYVRNTLRQWASEIPEIPFYDTINLLPDIPDPQWFTVEFFAESKLGMIGCPGYQERGVADFVFCATAGTGDEALLLLLEPAIIALSNRSDPNKLLTIEETEPVRDDSGGTADSTYRLVVGVRYVYSV